jgi:hypothetical protein
LSEFLSSCDFGVAAYRLKTPELLADFTVCPHLSYNSLNVVPRTESFVKAHYNMENSERMGVSSLDRLIPAIEAWEQSQCG